jgi:hypothetical protein
MAIAHPDLTFTVTPPGGSTVDYTDKLAWSGTENQMSITQNFGRQGDTGVFVLVDEYVTTPSVVIPVLSQVKLTDNTAGQVLFAGVCNDPILDVTSPTRNEWNLQCTDYTFYMDNKVVHGNFYGKTTDQIVVSLVAQASCGVTAATVANGGYVAPGPQIASFELNYTSLSSALRKLSQLAGIVTPFGWYVDELRQLHFFDASTASSTGVTFTTTPTASGGGSLTEGHFAVGNNFGYEWDGTTVHNRILVQGADQTIGHTTVPTGTPTDTWRSNGVQHSWPLRHTPSGNLSLRVGSKSTAVDQVEAGSTSTSTWQVAQNANGQWFLNTTGTVPANGITIKLWYDYRVPVVAQANDFASQTLYAGPNGGVYEEFINDSSLFTVPMALNRAQRERQEYAFAAERITFTSTEEFLGWVRAGDAITVVNQFIPDAQNNYSIGINDLFLIISNSITFTVGGYRNLQITAIRI